MAFKKSKSEKEFIQEAADVLTKEQEQGKKTTVLIYLSQEQKEFLEKVKYEKRASKISMSDLISEAIEQYLKKKYKGTE
jgi:hypothetical protein